MGGPAVAGQKDEHHQMYIKAVFGGCEALQKLILCDFFKHGALARGWTVGSVRLLLVCNSSQRCLDPPPRGWSTPA